jgi:hypothetical protein
MAKPIFIISLFGRISNDHYIELKKRIEKCTKLMEDYHVLVFDNEPEGNNYCVLNGEYDDIQDLEEYIEQLKNEANG